MTMTITMLQDKQGVQYMVTGDGSDIVQQHNGMAAVTTSVTHQQYVQVQVKSKWKWTTEE